jgi:hypothetical protein
MIAKCFKKAKSMATLSGCKMLFPEDMKMFLNFTTFKWTRGLNKGGKMLKKISNTFGQENENALQLCIVSEYSCSKL